MAAAAKSSAALTAERELMAAAVLALTVEGYHNPQVVRVERAGPGVLHALFHIEQVGGVRGARLAAIRTDNGTPAVVVCRGWPLELP